MWSRFLTVAIILSLGIAGSVRGQTAGTYDGPWSGTTSQEELISFNVGGSAITQLKVNWKLPLEQPCGTALGPGIVLTALGGNNTWYFYSDSPGNEPVKLTGNKLRLVKGNIGGREQVSLTLTGEFSSPREVSGTLELSSAPCKGATEVTWKAKRDEKQPEEQ